MLQALKLFKFSLKLEQPGLRSFRSYVCMNMSFLQVSSEYKMRRRIFEPPPPPTAQTEQARNLKFGVVGP